MTNQQAYQYRYKQAESNDIDFVVTWVNGFDKEWLIERAKCASEAHGCDNGDDRFRDLGLLRYWFRGVERFAPWVRKVHFVTWGHLPEWLNINHPKLHVVQHSEFIPAKYLPTFNSNAIELNCHRIDELAECFVLFNDDTFLVGNASPSLFFDCGIPKSAAVLSPIRAQKGDLFYTPFSNIAILNNHFSAQKSIVSNPLKWINPLYGKDVFRTLLMLPYPSFYGFKEYHLPNAFRKSTFERVWEVEHDTLEATCLHKFRYPLDVSQLLIREWQIASGCFEPQKPNVGKVFDLGKQFVDQLYQACKAIETQRLTMICINDGHVKDADFMVAMGFLEEAFQSALPEKSGYEI